jgi:hypothetical protein
LVSTLARRTWLNKKNRNPFLFNKSKMSGHVGEVMGTGDSVVGAGIMSAGQPKTGRPSYQGEEEAGPESDDITDKDGRHRYGTVAVAIGGRNRKGNVKMRTAFKIPKMTVDQWVEINLRAIPLPVYASLGLMAAPLWGNRAQSAAGNTCWTTASTTAKGATLRQGCGAQMEQRPTRAATTHSATREENTLTKCALHHTTAAALASSKDIGQTTRGAVAN